MEMMSAQSIKSSFDAAGNRYWPLMLSFAALGMLVCALVHRHLYADGCFYLIRVLENRAFTTFEPTRLFAQCIMEGPLLMAINWLHIADFRILSWIYGATLFLHPIASLWGCWRILKRRNRALMILPALCWACLSLCTSFFIISESWVGVSLFWPIYFLLLYNKQPLSRIEGLFLVAMCIASMRVYEGFFVSAGLLAFLAYRRVHRSLKLRKPEFSAILALLCLGVAMAADLYWSLYPRDPGNRISLLKGILVFFKCAPAYSIVFAAAIFTRWNRPRSRTVIFCIAIFLLAAFAWSVVPWVSVLNINPNRHADIRFINNLLPAGLGILPFAATKIRSLRPTFGRYRRMAFAGFALATLLWQLAACVAWRKYLTDFSAILGSDRGFVELKDSNLSRSGFDWPWTMPCMSIVLSAMDGKPIRTLVLNKPECPWEPFDSRTPDKYPDLGRYGVRYEIKPR
jgi:hypothetical protein